MNILRFFNKKDEENYANILKINCLKIGDSFIIISKDEDSG